MQQNPICTLDELAGWYKIQLRHAARVFRKLSDEHGFPRPLPGPPNRWSRQQVLDWLNGGGSAPAALPPDMPAPPAGNASYLERRYTHAS